jgi:NADH-quinone oxidoreductase subunit A
VQFNFRFYLIALIFIIFDVEIAFMFPVAAVFRRWIDSGQGLLALAEILVFVLILFLGLVYVWAKGDLKWQKRIPAGGGPAHDAL